MANCCPCRGPATCVSHLPYSTPNAGDWERHMAGVNVAETGGPGRGNWDK